MQALLNYGSDSVAHPSAIITCATELTQTIEVARADMDQVILLSSDDLVTAGQPSTIEKKRKLDKYTDDFILQGISVDFNSRDPDNSRPFPSDDFDRVEETIPCTDEEHTDDDNHTMVGETADSSLISEVAAGCVTMANPSIRNASQKMVRSLQPRHLRSSKPAPIPWSEW